MTNMDNIYLASDSKARKEMLRAFGIRFKVMPSRVKERKSRGKLTFAELVKKNALDKASSVAGRVSSGIIVAADTITVQNKKVFGKPKDIKDARRMLKVLSRAPQWLYTGIAVIRKQGAMLKVLTDCEKTKVYMDNLSDSQISDYFSRVSPLDKAGSFDIQGRGAFFIKRIEGCYYNVVGLPVRKLYRMLKKLNVNILSVVLCSGALVFWCSLLSGCSTEYNIATGQEESFYYTTDREVALGKAIEKEVEKEEKLDGDPLVQKRVQDIGKKIAAVCDRKEIDYTFKVLEDDEVNAVSLPGGIIYINKGLVDKVSNDDELAAVLAHEVAHVVARHSIKKLQGMQAYSVLRILVTVAPGGGKVGSAADAAFVELLLGYSREDELLADQLGARYSKLAGYNPRGMIDFLEKLQEVNRRKPLAPKSYFKTHPYVPDRIRVVKGELGEGMDFEDYINIEQKPH